MWLFKFCDKLKSTTVVEETFRLSCMLKRSIVICWWLPGCFSSFSDLFANQGLCVCLAQAQGSLTRGGEKIYICECKWRRSVLFYTIINTQTCAHSIMRWEWSGSIERQWVWLISPQWLSSPPSVLSLYYFSHLLPFPTFLPLCFLLLQFFPF